MVGLAKVVLAVVGLHRYCQEEVWDHLCSEIELEARLRCFGSHPGAYPWILSALHAESHQQHGIQGLPKSPRLFMRHGVTARSSDEIPRFIVVQRHVRVTVFLCILRPPFQDTLRIDDDHDLA